MKNSRISLALKAIRELGPQKLVYFALYKVGLKTGYFKYKSRQVEMSSTDTARPVLDLPKPDALRDLIGLDGVSQVQAEANEIVSGFVRIFGGEPVQLDLTPPGELSHWTELAQGKNEGVKDIKFVWEPARFGWAFTLGRAYLLTQDERYPDAFWRYFENFQQFNPVNMGPNWESAQEVALRLIAMVFAAQIFADSKHSSLNRQSEIATSIADHAARIPVTLIYARSQNNNHLLSEAAGLITASLALPEHPRAKYWSKLGWKWFVHGLQSQIADDGAYMQQSTNYHRLMLQLVLWVNQITAGLHNPERIKNPNLTPVIPKIQLATKWLLALCDPESGGVPNLGPNDGAYILPLTVLPFHDYRPVLQTASLVFFGEPTFDVGTWDEMSLWLGSNQWTANDYRSSVRSFDADLTRSISILEAPQSWAYLRTAHFHDRPGHADQLHLDLWWRGLNVAQDAGTYLYNADHPWENALAHTAVHNTVMVDNQQQMTPAGRFLYLDRAQAEELERNQAQDGSWKRITARHDGYKRSGLIHQRAVTVRSDGSWIVEDQLIPIPNAAPYRAHSARLHWLLPDWQWKIEDSGVIQVLSPHGWVKLSVHSSFDSVQDEVPSGVSHQLIRAGELVHGTGELSPTWGWFSPTYGVKKPALSFAVIVAGAHLITFSSRWDFPDE